jgi:hypothetical protein
MKFLIYLFWGTSNFLLKHVVHYFFVFAFVQDGRQEENIDVEINIMTSNQFSS